MIDARLRFPFSWLVCGGSGSGKTTHILNFLKFHNVMTNNPACSNIVYYYNQWQEMFDHVLQEKTVSRFIKGLPTLDDVQFQLSLDENDTGSIIIIDDFAHLINQDTLEMFTVLSHHGNMCIILLSQFLFSKNPVHRQISLNSTYISVFKNPRDNQQIATFARQLKPNNSKFVVDSYEQATKKPFSYIFFDNHQQTCDEVRIRSRILPHEAPMNVWVERKTV